MSRSRSSSSSSSSSVERTSSDNDESATSRRRRTTSEQSARSEDDRPTRRTRRPSQTDADEKVNKHCHRRGRDDDKSKSEDRRRKKDEGCQPERGEKRRGDSTTTAHKSKSCKDGHYGERPSKPEPKFEPRISMYKYDPVQGVMHETAQYNDHRHRLSRARSLVDNKAPPDFGHVQQNMRKLKEKQERQDEIERDNQRLLERLVKAMTTKRVDNWNNVDNRLVKASREKERQKILQMAAENRKIAQRIETRQATVNSNRAAVAPAAGSRAAASRQPARRAERPAERPGWRDD